MERHLGERTWEVDCAIIISIDLVDHILKLRLRRVLAERAHNGSQLLGSDLSCQTPISHMPCLVPLKPCPNKHCRSKGLIPHPPALASQSMVREYISRVLTIAILVLFQAKVVSIQLCKQAFPLWDAAERKGQEHNNVLTNREKASLNSETCSSVRESACERVQPLAYILLANRGHPAADDQASIAGSWGRFRSCVKGALVPS